MTNRALFLLAMAALPAAAADIPHGLSPAQMEGLLAGRGMGLSMPAELAGKPGPLHVIELADPLGLGPEQRRHAAETMEAMTRAAIPIGREVIRLETELDGLFPPHSPDIARIGAVTAAIARLNGELRLVHLKAHLAMAAALDPEQIARYDHLRRQPSPKNSTDRRH